MSNTENTAQKPQDQAAPPTEAPPASEAKIADESQGGLKEVGVEELLERVKMDAPASEAGSKPEQDESQKQETPKTDAVEEISILEKARQLLEQEGQEKASEAIANVTSDLQQGVAGGQDLAQDKTGAQIGDTPGAEKAADAEKKDAAEAKEEGKQVEAEVPAADDAKAKE